MRNYQLKWWGLPVTFGKCDRCRRWMILQWISLSPRHTLKIKFKKSVTDLGTWYLLSYYMRSAEKLSIFTNKSVTVYFERSVALISPDAIIQVPCLCVVCYSNPFLSLYLLSSCNRSKLCYIAGIVDSPLPPYFVSHSLTCRKNSAGNCASRARLGAEQTLLMVLGLLIGWTRHD